MQRSGPGCAGCPAVLNRVVDGFHLQGGSVQSLLQLIAQGQDLITQIQQSGEHEHRRGKFHEEVQQFQHGTPRQRTE